MDIKSMHYEFKLRFNKLDSNDRREYKAPEIDVLLNMAQDTFIKRHIPYADFNRGIEYNQRSTENLRSLVVNQTSGVALTGGVASLPNDYLYFLSGFAVIERAGKNKTVRVKVYQHDDVLGNFDEPSFMWNHVPVRFTDSGIRVEEKGFNVSSLRLNYIRQPKWMHNAEDWQGGQYNYNGVTYSGTQDCELSDIAHREIVELAVLLGSESSDSPMVERKLSMLQINH